METQKATGEITFSLRISGELNEKIIAAAQKEKRSRQAHIVYSLEKLFADTPEAKGEKEKTK
jgi:predicted HicB family RNase H-like nuclease